MEYTITYNHQSQFIEMFGGLENKKPISSVCNVSSGKSIPKDLEDEKGKIPYVKVADFNLENNQDYIISSSRYVSSEAASFSKMIGANTVIFAKNGAASMSNKKRLTKIQCCIDMNIMSVEIISQKLHPIYLLYTFRSVDIASLSRQGAVPSISPQTIETLEISLPPMVLQEEFADIVSQADKSKYCVQNKLNNICHILTNQIRLRRCS